MITTKLLRRTALVAAGAAVLALPACDALFGPDHDPYYFAMLIQSADGPPLAVYADGELSGNGLLIREGVPAYFSVTFIDDEGGQVLPDGSQLFRVTVKPSPGITFEGLGGYEGTLTGAAVGTVNVRFGLYHVEAGHHDFGLFTVPVTIEP